MRIKYSDITVDSVFHLPCGCGFPEDVEITDIPEELIARIDQLSADTNKTVLSPADISDCVSVSFSKLMIYESVSLKIKLRFTPVSFVCARMRSSEFIISLLEKNLKFDFKCTTDKQSYTPAMLAVDLGNTRTCAVVCPDIRDVRMEKLHLFPHYNANIEPSNGVWDSICVLGKSAVYEHVSPSFVRLGKDNMFYLRNGANNSSTALRSLSTPKRYFWDTDEDRKWILVRPGRTEEYLLREQTDMELAKHIAEHSYAGKYPRAMILEGTIYEMLEQAERMMNQEMDSASQYHAVTDLTMTYPAAWSSEEIEAYRVVVQRSIDLYVSQRCLNIPIKLHMECNEATAVLVNYIYSEAHHFGNGETWLKLMGKPDFEGSAEHSLRVAVIDIGGGTSDLAIANISWDSLHRATKIETCYTYGTNEAGDALIAKVIKEIILDKLFNFMVLQTTSAERREVLKSFLVKDVIPELKSLSRSFWFPLAVSYLENIEKDDSFKITLYSPRQTDTKKPKELKIKGLGALGSAPEQKEEKTISFFAKPDDTGAKKALVTAEPNKSKNAVEAKPEKNTKNTTSPFSDDFRTLLGTFFDMVEKAGSDLGKGNLSNYVVKPEALTETLALEFSVEDREKYRDLLRTCFRFSPMIFGSALAAYQCDIVIWSGKTSENKDIRSLFEEQIPVPPSSFISMNDYEIKTNDFPLTGLNGRLSDSKFATAIGAALYTMLQINGNANLNLLMVQRDDNQPRYWGRIDANGRFTPLLMPGDMQNSPVDYGGGMLLIYRSNCNSPLAFPSPAYEFRTKPDHGIASVDHLQIILKELNGRLDFELINGNYTLHDGTRKSFKDTDAKDDFELRLRMVGTNEIWLDTGKIF